MRREITTAGMPWPESESASVGCGSPCSFVTSTQAGCVGSVGGGGGPRRGAASAEVHEQEASRGRARPAARRCPQGESSSPAARDRDRPGDHRERRADTSGHDQGQPEDAIVRDRGDRDRVGGAARRRDRAEPALVALVARGDDRRHPGARRSCDRLLDEVVAGPGLGLAERQVQDVHPVTHGAVDRARDLRRVAVEPERGRRRGQDAVAAQIRVGGDARQVGDPDAVDHRRDPRVAGGDAGDMGAVLGSDRIEGRVLPRTAIGRCERAGDDHLAVDAVLQPLREARG